MGYASKLEDERLRNPSIESGSALKINTDFKSLFRTKERLRKELEELKKSYHQLEKKYQRLQKSYHRLCGREGWICGRVKWFSEQKGYGFITVGDGEEAFVHYSSIRNSSILKAGQEVELEIQSTSKGLEAVDVIVIRNTV